MVSRLESGNSSGVTVEGERHGEGTTIDVSPLSRMLCASF